MTKKPLRLMRSLISTIAVSQLLGASAIAQEPAPVQPRIISADYTQVAGLRSQTYRSLISAGRAGEVLRADFQEHLRMVQQDIGFRSMRFHGIFSDDMGVYSEDKKGNPIYNWQYVDLAYDHLLKMGIRPLVEIGFMPQALAADKNKKIFWWNGSPSAPKDWNKWQDFVTAFVTHLTERYGQAEVSQWNFEIWNEPDVGAFSSASKGEDLKTAYFTLYEKTVRAIKKIDPAYRVGGPSVAWPKDWINDLIKYADDNQVSLDFITYHAYGLAGQNGGYDPDGEKRFFIQKDPLNLGGTITSGINRVKSTSRPTLPIYVTEWNTSYAKLDLVHDSYYNAAQNLATLRVTDKFPQVAGMGRWTFTDVFEEDGVPSAPFTGGFGMINLQGIKKPVYFAYKYLSALGDKELVNKDKLSWVTRDDKGGLQALVFDASYPMKEPLKQSNKEFFSQIQPPLSEAPVILSIDKVPAGTYRLEVYRTGFKKNDAYTRYLELGAPKYLSLAQVAELKEVASDKPEIVETVKVASKGHFERSFPLRSNDIYLAIQFRLCFILKG